MIAAWALAAGLALADDVECPHGCPGLADTVSTPTGETAPVALPSPTVTRLARGYVNVWVLRAGDAVVVVDAHYGRAGRWLERALADAGIDPALVTAIVVTHAHSDHLAGAAALRERSHAPLILGAADAGTAADGHNPPLRSTSLLAALVKPSIGKRFDPVTPDVLVDALLDLRPYGIAGEVLVTGGHTDGHVIVRLADGGVLAGDLVRGKMAAHHRPTEHLYQPDREAVHAILAQLIAEGATTFYPGHGDVLTAEDVQAWLERKGD